MKEVLIALQTPSPKGHRGVPVLLWGAPGVGKSSFIESLARDDFPVLTLIGSLHDPTDFNGLPVLEGGEVRFAPPAWVRVFEEHGQGVLFLDELTTAPPAVQAAMLRLVLERTVGQYKLPDGVAIVAAANPPSEAAGGWELAPPLVNRFTHLFIKPDIEGFCRAMEAGHWEKPSLDDIVIAPEAHAQARLVWGKRVAQFLRLNPALVSTAGNDDNPAFATMRSWDYAVSLMASCEVIGAAPKPRGAISDEFANLVVGTIGEAAALPFFDWVRNMRLPSAKGVLEGREIVDPAILREDEINVVFGEMTRIVVDDGVDMKVGAVNYLDTAIRLVENEKADIVFVHVRELVEKGALPKLHKVAPDKVVELSDKLYSFGEQVERLATN